MKQDIPHALSNTSMPDLEFPLVKFYKTIYFNTVTN